MGTITHDRLLALRESIAHGTGEQRRAARLDVAKIDPSDLPEHAREALIQLETQLNLTLDENGDPLEGASFEPLLARIEDFLDVLDPRVR
jgi:hypothetical protein